MNINEYTPKCGWIKHRRHQKIFGYAKAAAAFLAVFAACWLGGLGEMGM